MNGVYVAETLDDPDGLWTALVSVASVLSATGDDGLKKKNQCVYWWWIRCRARFASRTRRARAERDPRARLGTRRRAASRYAHRHDVAVVVTNHVVDAFGGENDNAEPADLKRLKDHSKKKNVFGPAGALSSSGRDVAPALGLFWANCVNTRLFLRRSGGSAGGFGGGEGVGGGGVVGGGHARGVRGVLVAPAALQGRGGRRRADAVRRAKGGRLRSSFRGRFGRTSDENPFFER